MKYNILILYLISSITFAQTEINSFVNSRTNVYSYPHEDSLTKVILNPFEDITVLGITKEYYEIKNYGFVKRKYVNQNDSIVKLNFTLVPKEFKSLEDSIKSYLKFNSVVYNYPDKDSSTNQYLPAMTDVVVTESKNGFFKIYGYGYVEKYKVFKN